MDLPLQVLSELVTDSVISETNWFQKTSFPQNFNNFLLNQETNVVASCATHSKEVDATELHYLIQCTCHQLESALLDSKTAWETEPDQWRRCGLCWQQWWTAQPQCASQTAGPAGTDLSGSPFLLCCDFICSFVLGTDFLNYALFKHTE